MSLLRVGQYKKLLPQTQQDKELFIENVLDAVIYHHGLSLAATYSIRCFVRWKHTVTPKLLQIQMVETQLFHVIENDALKHVTLESLQFPIYLNKETSSTWPPDQVSMTTSNVCAKSDPTRDNRVSV